MTQPLPDEPRLYERAAETRPATPTSHGSEPRNGGPHRRRVRSLCRPPEAGHGSRAGRPPADPARLVGWLAQARDRSELNVSGRGHSRGCSSRSQNGAAPRSCPSTTRRGSEVVIMRSRSAGPGVRCRRATSVICIGLKRLRRTRRRRGLRRSASPPGPAARTSTALLKGRAHWHERPTAHGAPTSTRGFAAGGREGPARGTGETEKGRRSKQPRLRRGLPKPRETQRRRSECPRRSHIT